MCICFFLFFFFKQKTAYEMRISDWSSDVCSSDLPFGIIQHLRRPQPVEVLVDEARGGGIGGIKTEVGGNIHETERQLALQRLHVVAKQRSEEHKSELQSLMRISYAVFCSKKNKRKNTQNHQRERTIYRRNPIK